MLHGLPRDKFRYLKSQFQLQFVFVLTPADLAP